MNVHVMKPLPFATFTSPAMFDLPLKRQSRLQQTIFINIFHCFSEKIRLDVSSEAEDLHEKSSLFFFER